MKKLLLLSFFTLFLFVACDQTPGYSLSFQNNTNNNPGGGNMTLYNVTGAIEEDYGVSGRIIPVGSIHQLQGETEGVVNFEVGFSGINYRNVTTINLAVGGTYQLRFTQNGGTLYCNLYQTDGNQPITLTTF